VLLCRVFFRGKKRQPAQLQDCRSPSLKIIFRAVGRVYGTTECITAENEQLEFTRYPQHREDSDAMRNCGLLQRPCGFAGLLYSRRRRETNMQGPCSGTSGQLARRGDANSMERRSKIGKGKERLESARGTGCGFVVDRRRG
jgi:hypothetical protein